MAGDWIKMRVDLGTSPKVVRIASALRADRLRVIGGLHAVWCLFDVHSVDGRLDGYTEEALDELIGFQGFSDAMLAVGWLVDTGDGLEAPRFDEHNGQSAKRRAMETERKREARKMSAPDADKKRSREEKRREDKPPTAPQGGGDEDFSTFWDCWPKNDRKQDKAKCLDKWKRFNLDAVAGEIMADVKAKKLTQKWIDGYVEAPLVYLNNRRWEDGNTAQRDGVKVGSDEYLEFHRNQDWWREAGFDSVYEAISSRCNHKNAHQFRDGKRVEVAA